MDKEAKLYRGGITTDPEIKLLMDLLDKKKTGEILTHDEAAELIRLNQGTPRYNGIMQKLKNKLFQEKNIELRSVRGIGYKVISATERLSAVIHDASGAFKRIKEVGERASLIPREQLETEQERKKADHVQMALARVVDETSKVRKEISLPVREQLPRLVLAAKNGDET